MRDSSFLEEWLKDMVSDASMNPSDKVWDSIRIKLEAGNRRFYKLLLLPAFIMLFSGMWLTTGTFRSVILPESITFLRNEISSAINQTSHKDITKQANKVNQISYKKVNQLIAPAEEKEEAGIRLIAHTQPVPSKEYNHLNAPPSISSTNKKIFYPTSMGSGIVSKNVSSLNRPVIKDKKKNSLSLQLYMTPSASYRIMTNQYILRPGESLSERRNNVRHYPATGMEVGIGLIKPITRRWSMKGGLQVNFSRYQIKGSETDQELVFVSTSPVSGFEESSRMSNTDGNKPKKLMNENLQLSVPVGLDYQVFKKKKIAIHAAGSVQPGFTIHASGHLITSNYKNYIQAEHLFRRFNMQSALEAYIRINAGSIDFHAGPQIRYQLLSNIVDLYPIKEHLMDYGFKIGLVKQIK